MASMIATATVIGASDMVAVFPVSMSRYSSKFQVMGLVQVELDARGEPHVLINAANRPSSPTARALYDFMSAGRRQGSRSDPQRSRRTNRLGERCARCHAAAAWAIDT